jgi:FMN phosphatase YigB (HAD superfamily)
MLTIAWDVDDILNDLMRFWLSDKWLLEHPDCKVSFKQLTENTPERIIKSTLEEYRLSLDSFRLSGAYTRLEPNPEVLAWFRESGYKARHIALTAVSVKAAYISADWVLKNFGKWIRTFHFIPSLRADEAAPEYDQSKADYLKWLNKVDVLVEDSEDNILQAKDLGIRGILVGKPWNKGNLSVKEALTELNKLL